MYSPRIPLVVIIFLAAIGKTSTIGRMAILIQADEQEKANAASSPSDEKKDDKPKKKGRGHFTISKETTFVTGPVDKDGYIDYAAALNERLRLGVTPENNANVLIWKALGPQPDHRPKPSKFFQEIGMQMPPESGQYFIDVDRYERENLKIEMNGDEFHRFNERLTHNMERPWDLKHNRDLFSWLEVNEKPLALIIEATKRSQFYAPIVAEKSNKSASVMSALFSSTQKCRAIASALAARAMLRLGRRDYDGAWDDLIACHQLGRIVGRGPSIVDCLIAVAIDGVAERADLALLDAIKSDTKRLQKCLGDLQKLPPVPEIADKVNLCERYTQLEMLMTIDRDSEKFLKSLSTVISLSYAFSDTFGGSAWPTNEKDRTKLVNLISDLIGKDLDWDPALRNVNEWFDQVVKLSNVKCRTQREKKWDKINEKVEALKKKLLSGSLQLTLEDAKVGSGAKGKFISGIWLCWVIPGAQKVQNATDRAKQTQDILCLAFALAWYHCDHGSYPKTLDVLAPKYLANVPRDMFSDKPLIYRPSDKGYLLYSVGVNGKDEGGRDYTFEPRGDDLAIRMPLPEWKPY